MPDTLETYHKTITYKRFKNVYVSMIYIVKERLLCAVISECFFHVKRKRKVFKEELKKALFSFFNMKKTLITAYQQHSDQVIHCERLPRG
ncbi:hypothetical protein CUU95_09105 [Vreelandella alkaliphila]|nr:hypothetical protein CUU95_09105 [Halomonas alkaliphila]